MTNYLTADLAAYFDTHRRVLIVTHRFPDFDAIGSSLAWMMQLRSQGHDVVFWVADDLFDLFKILPNISLITQTVHSIDSFDTLLCLDASNIDRIRDIELLNVEDASITTINIDHHKDNALFGDINVLADISSVGELSTHLFSELGWPINADIASCLYAAILFDTGGFLHPNVTALTFRAAANLTDSGAKTEEISAWMFERLSKADFTALNVSLDRFVIRSRYAYSVLPKGVKERNLKVIDILRKIKDVDVVLVFRELDDENIIKINLRSKGDFNVSMFSALFGGGGHRRASGISTEGSLKEVIASVIDTLEECLDNSAFFAYD